MKDSVQRKLSYVNFDITEIDEVMCYVFGKWHRYYAKLFSLTQILLKDLKRWLMKFKKNGWGLKGEGLLNGIETESLKW